MFNHWLISKDAERIKMFAIERIEYLKVINKHTHTHTLLFNLPHLYISSHLHLQCKTACQKNAANKRTV